MTPPAEVKQDEEAFEVHAGSSVHAVIRPASVKSEQAQHVGRAGPRRKAPRSESGAAACSGAEDHASEEVSSSGAVTAMESYPAGAGNSGAATGAKQCSRCKEVKVLSQFCRQVQAGPRGCMQRPHASLKASLGPWKACEQPWKACKGRTGCR
jgi:hypothetical protein